MNLAHGEIGLGESALDLVLCLPEPRLALEHYLGRRPVPDVLDGLVEPHRYQRRNFIIRFGSCWGELNLSQDVDRSCNDDSVALDALFHNFPVTLPLLDPLHRDFPVEVVRRRLVLDLGHHEPKLDVFLQLLLESLGEPRHAALDGVHVRRPPVAHSLAEKLDQTGVHCRSVGKHLVGSDGCLGPRQEFTELIEADTIVGRDSFEYGLLGGVEEPVQWEVGPGLHPLAPDFGARCWTNDSNQQDTELVYYDIGGELIVGICREWHIMITKMH